VHRRWRIRSTGANRAPKHTRCCSGAACLAYGCGFLASFVRHARPHPCRARLSPPPSRAVTDDPVPANRMPRPIAEASGPGEPASATDDGPYARAASSPQV
jgi:hypothetical protein